MDIDPVKLPISEEALGDGMTLVICQSVTKIPQMQLIATVVDSRQWLFTIISARTIDRTSTIFNDG